MFAVMSDRCSVNKAFNNRLVDYKERQLGSEEADTNFLFYNAHFLWGLSTACESELNKIEKEWATELGHGIGRDALNKFKCLKSNSESTTCRYV